MGARQDIIRGLLGLLDDYIAANPTLLRRRFKVRPPTLITDTPCAYIDLRPETVHYDSAIRDRVFQPSIVFVDRLTDNGETMDRFDALVDSFSDFIGTNQMPYAYLSLTAAGVRSNGVWSQGTWSDEQESLGSPDGSLAPAAAARFTFTDVLYKDSRL